MRTITQSGPLGPSQCYETDIFPDIFTVTSGSLFEAAVAYNEKHTSMKPLSATRMPVFLCDILPAAVCSSFFSPAEAVFPP